MSPLKTGLARAGRALALCALALPLLAHGQIAFRAASTTSAQSVAPRAPSFQAIGAADTGIGAVSPSWPAHAVGDVGLLICESAGTQTATLTTANGFAAVPNGSQTTGTVAGGTTISVFWARATTTTMADPVVGDTGDHLYCRIVTYRNVIAAGNPWDVTAGGVKAGASTTATAGGVTTTLQNTLVVHAVAHNLDSAAAQFGAPTNGNLSGLAERGDAGTTSGNGGGFAVWDGAWANAGASGNTTSTVTNSVNAWVSLALLPGAPRAPAFQAAGTPLAGVGALSPAWPAGHLVDDIGILVCESAGTQTASLTTAAGFAAVTNGSQTTGTVAAGTSLSVFWARATSTAMASPTVGDTGDHLYCVISTYRGVIDTGNPWEVTAGGVNTPASTGVSLPAVTTETDNTLIVQIATRANDANGAGFSGQANGNLTGLAERFDNGTNSGNGGGFVVYDGELATAGASGTTTATGPNSVNGVLTIALLPAGAGPKLAVPGAVQQGDLMVVAIAVRPSGVTIAAPAGWTAETATLQATGNTSRQQIFWKVADAADDAGRNYAWSFGSSATGVVGGLVAYSGVDVVSASPIDVIGGNATPVGGDANTSHRANGVTTTVPNTMVISMHSLTSSELWTAPGGMTERVDVSSEATPNTAGIGLSMNEVGQVAVAATGDKIATVGGNGDTGVAQIIALRPAYAHYAISALATTVANCDYAEITITGHAANDAVVAPSGLRTVTLSVSAGGATAGWQATLVAGSGTWTPSGASATYLWPGTETSFTVRLRQSAVVTLSVNAIDEGSVTEQSGPEDPDFSFVNSAFRISDGANNAAPIGTQISGKGSDIAPGSQTLFLQAVRTDTLSGACTTVFAQNTDVDIEVGARCISPATCGQNVTLATSALSSNGGSFTPAGAASFPATIKFRFTTASAEAPFSFSYADAGQIRLQFRHVTAAPATTITGNSNDFVVRPFGFAFLRNTTTAIQHDNVATNAPNFVAGDNFSMAIGAYRWTPATDANNDGIPDTGANITGNGLTPNFAASVTIGVQANLPGIAPGNVNRGANCNTAATIASGEWAGGFGAGGGVSTAITDWCYSEAGNAIFTATSDDYLGATDADIVGNSGLDGDANGGYVGRFRPKHFAVSAGVVTNRAALTCPGATWTYMGERLDLGFTLTAQNAQGGTTRNYHGAYAKLALNAGNLNLGARSGSTPFLDAGVTPNNRVATTGFTGTWGNGVGGQEGTAAITMQSGILRRTSGSVFDGPYTAVNFGIAPTDGEVSMNALDLDINTTAGDDVKNIGVTTEVRFGRLRQQNAVASSGAIVLPVPITLQYWDGTNFVTNSTDACTTIAPASVTLSTPTFTPAGSASVLSVPIANGQGSIRLAGPGAGNRGFVVVTPSLPVYLQGNWTGGTWDQNPSNRAAWGVFGSQPQNFIYQRENY